MAGVYLSANVSASSTMSGEPLSMTMEAEDSDANARLLLDALHGVRRKERDGLCVVRQ